MRVLSPTVRKTITPCLEVLPTALPDDPNKLRHAASELARNVGRSWGTDPLYVDLSYIQQGLCAEDGEHILSLLASAAAEYHIKPIFTVWLYQNEPFKTAAADAVHIQDLGAAIRLNYVDLDKSDIAVGLNALVSRLGLTRASTDVFVECGIIDDNNPPDYDWLCSRIPNIGDWRRFAVSGGAFPRDLMAFSVGRRTQPRYEWLHWQSWALAPKLESTRIPEFSDYTIQHAVFHEPPPGANPSASIRWAAETYWVIMRGQALRRKTKQGAAANQYRANAQLLSEFEEFSGPDFSFGDRYVWEVANKLTGPGTPATWITAGVARHITVSSHQVASL